MLCSNKYGQSDWFDLKSPDKCGVLRAMFNAKQLKKFMDAKPFRPFKVLTSDGKSYAVPPTMRLSLRKTKLKSAWT
jgi:hypothetical protein